jgi:hypothetical protein
LLLSVTYALTAIGGGPGDKGYTFLPVDDPDTGAIGTSVFEVNSSDVMVGNFVIPNVLFMSSHLAQANSPP